ncbi:MAG: hypothetical protein IH897_12335 [Planctomycetes bacterium]|nr:hypothetical protein [Planctomycetota bacterium]
MHRNRLIKAFLLFGVALPLLGGCLHRKESITISKDGSAVIKLDFDGDLDDLEFGDAMPSSQNGWEVTRSVERQDDGEETHILKATQAFAAGMPLPATFASPTDPDRDLYLRFPTTYRTETRDDGVYHYFHRVYRPRAWAIVQYWEEALIEDRHEELAKKPMEELTAGERQTLFEAFAEVEARKQLEYAKEAVQEAAPLIPSETQLQARRALLDAYGSADLGAIAGRCIDTPDDESRGACFEEETAKLLSDAHDAYVEVLTRVAGLDPTQLASWERAYQRSQRRYELTGMLANHQFEISVSMPGRIVAHNGDQVAENRPPVRVEWEFDGQAFRDRPYELVMITKEPLPKNAEMGSSSHER